MTFITLDFPREVLEVDSDGQKGFRRVVKSAEELESYWKGKNGSGNVYFTAYGIVVSHHLRTTGWITTPQSSDTSCVISIAKTSDKEELMSRLKRCTNR